MPSPAPGADQLAGGVEDDTAPVISARPGVNRAWWWAGASVFLLVLVVLFDAYLHLSKTYMENSDEANILLMAHDMLHGNLYLTGWNTSDVPFITTELPEIAVLVAMFGLHLNTAHIAAAVTYTIVIALAMLLAKGRARGPQAIMRMALVLAIMLAPQPGIGVFVLVFSVGHIGTAAPVMLTWLVLDRFGLTTRAGIVPTLRQRWYIPLIVAVLIGWALMADPLVLVVAIYPLLVVCLVRVITGSVAGARHGGGLRGLRQGLAARWLELSLAAAAGIGYLLVWCGGQLLSSAGGYKQQAVPFQLDGGVGRWFMQARVVVHGLLEMFGAYFVPGNAINYKSPGTVRPRAVAVRARPGPRHLPAGLRAARPLGLLRDRPPVLPPRRRLRQPAAAGRDRPQPRRLHPVHAGRPLGPQRARDRAGAAVRRGPGRPDARRPAARARPDDPGQAAADQQAARAQADRDSAGRALRLVQLRPFPAGRHRRAAANPFTGLEKFLEANNLSYGLGGYWEASVITVDTDGAVTIRAVSPSCMQPYEWENKLDWYDPSKHVANFVLLSNEPGYFTSFAVRGSALKLLIKKYGKKQDTLDYGNYFFNKGKPFPTYDYNVRTYQGNLLTQLDPLRSR